MQFWKVQVANLRPTKSLSVQRMGTVFLEAWAAGIATPPPPFPSSQLEPGPKFRSLISYLLFPSSFASLQFPISQLSFKTKIHKFQVQIFPVTSVKEKRMCQHCPLSSHAFAHELAQAHRYVRLLVHLLPVYIINLG